MSACRRAVLRWRLLLRSQTAMMLIAKPTVGVNSSSDTMSAGRTQQGTSVHQNPRFAFDARMCLCAAPNGKRQSSNPQRAGLIRTG